MWAEAGQQVIAEIRLLNKDGRQLMVWNFQAQNELDVGQTMLDNPAAPSDAQNLVLIVADDLGYGDLPAFWQQSAIVTPAIDKLAAQGVRFSSFHVNPLCTPTRAVLMTGQYTFDNYEPGGAAVNGIIQSVEYLPQILKRIGYRTGGFGKWHLGIEDGDHPIDRGFDEWIGFYGGGMPYHSSLADKMAPESDYKYNTIYKGKQRYSKTWSHTTDLFADEAIRFIEENAAVPFFVYLSFNAVHGPLWRPEKPIYSSRRDWRERIKARSIENPEQQDYYAVVEHMDDRIGSVLAALEIHGLESETLVIFLSDNGAITPDYYYSVPAAGSNGAFRAGKATVYEGGMRVPMIMRHPEALRAT